MKNYVYEPDKIRVSEAVNCLRKAFFNRFNPKKQNITCFSLYGKIAENEIKRKMLPRFHGWFENVIVQDDILVGHPDFVDYLHKRVVELKFRWRRTVKLSDLAQANAYACMLRFPHFTIRISWLVYNPSLHLQFSDLTVESRFDIFKKVKEKARCLLRAIESENVELIRIYPHWSWECRYCPHFECLKNLNKNGVEKNEVCL